MLKMYTVWSIEGGYKHLNCNRRPERGEGHDGGGVADICAISAVLVAVARQCRSLVERKDPNQIVLCLSFCQVLNVTQ